MGIPVDEPSFMFGDNQSVLANTANPGSNIKNKYQSICFHFIREGCDRDEWSTAYVKTCNNIADLLTKSLPNWDKHWNFVNKILHWLGGKAFDIRMEPILGWSRAAIFFQDEDMSLRLPNPAMAQFCLGKQYCTLSWVWSRSLSL